MIQCGFPPAVHHFDLERCSSGPILGEAAAGKAGQAHGNRVVVAVVIVVFVVVVGSGGWKGGSHRQTAARR